MPKHTFPSALCGASLLLLATGCALDPSRSEPAEQPVSEPAESETERVEPSPSDPFAAVDEAFARLSIDRSQIEADNEAREPLIWTRLVDQFEISSCPDGSSAQRWSEWYADNAEYMTRVLTRAKPWLHHIVDEIEARDLPGEFALLPVVESAFDPFAYSHGRAAGPWQFLSGTARDFGITINDFYDGRRDFIAATAAALDYLEHLGGLFDGDWALALAAYNAGQGRVRRAVRRNAARGRGTEWHELSLPRETLGYVPKLKGLGCLFRDPVRHAFVLPTIPDRPQVTEVAVDGSIDVAALALAAGLEPAQLVTLNAGLNQHRTPPEGPGYLVVPVDAAERVAAALGELPPAPSIPRREIRVRRGDSLSVLARRHNTSIEMLRKVNNLQGGLLVAGQTLKLPGKPGDAEPSGDPEYMRMYRELTSLQEQLLPTDRFIHRVRSGENLWTIARRYGVGVIEIQRMNGLSGTLIRPGQRLVIETGREVQAPSAMADRHVVRRGESLWAISRRYQVNLDELMRINGLDSDSVLRPGQELIIRRGGDA